MATRLNPYVNFTGNAREAMTFYQSVFGGDLQVSTFGEYGGLAGADGDLVMHAQLVTEDGFALMGADVPPGMDRTVGTSMAVSLSGQDSPTLTRWWQALSEGGDVGMPLEKQVWGDEFGMCTDRFGTPWMVNIGSTEG